MKLKIVCVNIASLYYVFLMHLSAIGLKVYGFLGELEILCDLIYFIIFFRRAPLTNTLVINMHPKGLDESSVPPFTIITNTIILNNVDFTLNM